MKEYIKKFANPAAADNYPIADIPFVTSVVENHTQNLVCNETGKKLVNESGYVYVCGEYEFIGNGNWSITSNWKDNIVPSEIYKNNIVVKGNMTISSVVCAHNFTIDSGYTVEIQDGGVLYIDGVSETQEGYGNIDAKQGGKLVIKQTGSLEVNNLIINATIADAQWNGNSCEIFGAERISINGDCYFDAFFEPNGNVSYGFYDFTVPFAVNQTDGIYGDRGNGFIKYTNGTNYRILRYKPNKENYNGVLEPIGGFYSITLDSDYTYQKVRFIWNKTGTIYGHNTYTYPLNSNTVLGAANFTLCISKVTGVNVNDITKILKYEHASNKYVAVDITNLNRIPIGSCVDINMNNNTQQTITWVPVNDLLNL